jgi:hypothetical protein
MVGNLIIDKTRIIGEAGRELSTSYPLPVDGDSVNATDIWIEESVMGDFSGKITDLFDNLHSIVQDSTATSPKIVTIHFNNTIATTLIALGAHTGNFSNIKIIGLVSGPIEFILVDEETNDTKYTTRQFDLESTGFNALRLEFYTTDEVTLTNVFIIKASSVIARVQGIKPDGTFAEFELTQGGNQKVSLEELENQVSVNNNSQLRTTLFDSDGREFKLDKLTNAFTTVSYEHHEIHSGSHYNYCDYALGQSASAIIEFIFTTPDIDTWTHLTFESYASEGSTIEVYEGTTGITGGTPIIPRNNNRNSINTSGIVLIKDPTSITNDGIRASGFLAGGGRTAGFASRGKENILKRNETYLLRISSLAVGNDISWCAEWYEHANPV